MAGSKSDDLENAVLNFLLGAVIPTNFGGGNAGGASANTAWLPVTQVYIRLWTASLGTGSGSEPCNAATAGEVSTSATGYTVASTVYPNNTTTAGWNVAGTTSTRNNAATLQYPAATASWGTVTTFGIFDGSGTTSATKVLYYGDLSASKTVGTSDTASFGAGQIAVTEN